MDLKEVERFRAEIAFKLTPEENQRLEEIAKMLTNYDFNTICEKMDLGLQEYLKQYIS